MYGLKKSNMIVAVDFDGTCVSHEFPEVGKDIGSVLVLKSLVRNGHQLILWTMRSDNPKRKHLTEAVNWFKDNDIPLYGVNTNPKQSVWTSSPKAYAQLYIDDAALGCPLMFDRETSERPFVDWVEVELRLSQTGLLSSTNETLEQFFNSGVYPRKTRDISVALLNAILRWKHQNPEDFKNVLLKDFNINELYRMRGIGRKRVAEFVELRGF